MSFFSSMFRSAGQSDSDPRGDSDSGRGRDPGNEYFWRGFGGLTSSGVRVSPEKAMQLPVVYACINLIANTISTVPLHVYRELPNGDKQRVMNHPLVDLFSSADSDGVDGRGMDVGTFTSIQQAFLESRGNAYSRIIGGPRGGVHFLRPMHPDRVQVVMMDDGDHMYRYRDPRGTDELLMRDEVWHQTGLTLSGNMVTGMSPIMEAATAVGAALAADDYSARFWANDSRPTGVIEMPGHFRSGEESKAWVEAWKKSNGGPGRHGTAVLENGMKFNPISIPNEHAQFLETQKYQDEDIARIFGVQPHMVGILDKATFSNISEQALEFVKYTIQPRLERRAISINQNLLVGSSSRGLYVKHDVDALLRADIRTRYESYATGISWGFLTVNEARRMDGRNSIGPEGDQTLRPVNMGVAGATPLHRMDTGVDAEASATILHYAQGVRDIREVPTE